MSATSVRVQHTEWLAALDGDGPWLTVPALTERLKDGLVPTTTDQNQHLKAAHTRWTTAHPNEATTAQEQWVRDIVADWLGWGDYATFTDLDRFTYRHTLNASHTITVTPSFALLPVPADEADEKTQPVILGFTHPTGTPLTKRVGDGWPTTPIDRAIHVMRDADVPLGLVTDGRWWALVWAPRQTTPGYALWSVDLLLDDELLRSAFVTLLSQHRSLGVHEDETLHGLFLKSQDSQEDITENLSKQVRKAVELLVDSFSTANRDADDAYFTYPTGTQDATGNPVMERVPDDDIYQAAVTLVMRLVFILAAEERHLLPADDDFYANAYGVAALADRLIDRANRDGDHLLGETHTAFPQLLATTRVIHDGIRHPRLNLPGYGGSVFDPDRFPWLEDAPAHPGLGPIGVDDRTMLHILRGLTRWEGRRLSYRTLDVEQIGYAYEGLLDHTAITATGPVLGLTGPKEPEIALDDLEAQAQRGDTHLAKWLKDATGLSPARLRNALADRKDTLDAAERQRLVAACNSDTDTAERVQPWLPLLRVDARTGLPIVINPGTTYVTASTARGDTGTHYTPKFLAEDVVETTLNGVLYKPGPLDSNDQSTWVLIHPEEMIRLKIADIAMGSGAFLVAVIRLVADRLLAALALVERETLTTPALIDLWDALHTVADDKPEWDLDPDDTVILQARRLIAAQVIYGVDINPMAVEMAKLSIWLVTAAKNQPFGFLDHRLIAGDSLLGLHDIRQLENLHLDAARGASRHGTADGAMIDLTEEIRSAVARATELRMQIDKQRVVDLRSVEEQDRLHHEVQALMADLRAVADAIAGSGLAAAKEATGKNYAAVLDAKASVIAQRAPALFAREATREARATSRDVILSQSQTWLTVDLTSGAPPRNPLHWPLVYPEVFLAADPGFDAIVGNPPFLGGQKLTGAVGVAYRENLVHGLGRGARGSADLVAYMLLRAVTLAAGDSGQIGLIATNTIAQGVTREVGLDQITKQDWTLRYATKSKAWPSRSANLEYSVVGLSGRALASGCAPVLDGSLVWESATKPGRISPSLDAAGRASGNPSRLAANMGIAFQGSIVLGLGFTMDPQEAQTLIAEDPKYADVLFPYLNGKDLNSSPEQTASRWVINFFDWDEDRARTYPDAFERVERLVKPERATNKRSARRDYWWRYAERASGLYAAIKQLARVIVIAQVSSTMQPARVSARQVLDAKLVAFATEDTGLLATLSTEAHRAWVEAWGTTMRTDLTYTPSSVFDTFPMPAMTSRLRSLGLELEAARAEVMVRRGIGLTATYNLLHDSDCRDSDVQSLRSIHEGLESALLASFGWSDLDASLDFRPQGRGVRFTWAPSVRFEVLDRLLELNHKRHAEEVAAGLVDAQGRPLKKSAGTKKVAKGQSGHQAGTQDDLFAALAEQDSDSGAE